MGETCLSGSALTLVGGLLLSLTGAIGVLFKALLASKDSQIGYLESLLDRSANVAGETVSVAREAITRERRR